MDRFYPKNSCTVIGKTCAYLAARTVYSHFRAASGLEPKPILVSASNIALQNAVRGKYLPLPPGLLLGRHGKPPQIPRLLQHLTHVDPAGTPLHDGRQAMLPAQQIQGRPNLLVMALGVAIYFSPVSVRTERKIR